MTRREGETAAEEVTREETRAVTLRLLIGTVVTSTFIILGVLSYAIVNINSEVQHSTETLYDGIICILEQLREAPEDQEFQSIDEIGEYCHGFSRGVSLGGL